MGSHMEEGEDGRKFLCIILDCWKSYKYQFLKLYEKSTMVLKKDKTNQN